jgi:hypothetical protein
METAGPMSEVRHFPGAKRHPIPHLGLNRAQGTMTRNFSRSTKKVTGK